MAILASFTLRAIAQISLTPKPIDDTESYAVYAALLPSQWTVRVARAKILVFQQETTTYPRCMPSGTPLSCLGGRASASPPFLMSEDAVLITVSDGSLRSSLRLRDHVITQPARRS